MGPRPRPWREGVRAEHTSTALRPGLRPALMSEDTPALGVLQLTPSGYSVARLSAFLKIPVKGKQG